MKISTERLAVGLGLVILFLIVFCSYKFTIFAVDKQVQRYAFLSKEISTADYKTLEQYRFLCKNDVMVQESMKAFTEDGKVTNQEYVDLFPYLRKCRTNADKEHKTESKENFMKNFK